jgi:hypothetical protein
MPDFLTHRIPAAGGQRGPLVPGAQPHPPAPAHLQEPPSSSDSRTSSGGSQGLVTSWVL